MENCLVTKLKGTVDNNNLKKLGVLTIKYSNYSSFDANVNFAIQTVGTGVTVKAVDSYFVNSSGVNIGDTLNISSNTDSYVLPAPVGSGTIEIHNKYNLKSLKVTDTKFDAINTSEIDYLVNVETIRVRLVGSLEYAKMLSQISIFEQKIFNNVFGDISNFAGHTHLTELNLSNQRDVDGNILSVGECIALTKLSIGGTIVYGTIESFVQAQRVARVAAGLSEGNSVGITMSYLSTCNVTFDGSPVPATFNSGCVLTWTGNTMTLTSGGNTLVVNA